MNLEHELRTALRRREPPAGFEDRVLTRLHAEPGSGPARQLLAWIRICLNPRIWAPALAALALLLLVAGQIRQQRRQEALAEQAGRQVIYALDLAASKLSYAQQKTLELQMNRMDR
jgi:hypothetical protein